MGELSVKKGIIIAPEDFTGLDWVEKCSALKLDTLAFHTGGRNHDILKSLDFSFSLEFKKRCTEKNIFCEFEEHTAGVMLDPALYSVHPEYFALNDNGSRVPGERTNWCISSSGMRDLLKENAANLARKLHSASHRYYFWSADGANSLCHCKECSRWNTADLNLLSVNVIAEGIRQADPQAEVAYLAYAGSSYDVPEKVVPHEAVFLEFAPYVRRFFAAIDDPANEINRRFHDALLKLLKFFPAKRTHILEYWLDVSLFCNHFREEVKALPVTQEIMYRDIDFYRGLGIENFSTFAVGMNGCYLKKFGEERLLDYAGYLNKVL